MTILIYILIAVFIVSAISLVGVLVYFINEKTLSKSILHLVAFSAGTLLGGAFLHLLPEANSGLAGDYLFIIVLISFILFFILEHFIHWRHCHKVDCDVHSFGYMNIFGDAVHNFVDGIVIASSFLAGTPIGIVTTIAIALHEIPQEISDFGVLLHAGFSRKKALLMNFLSAAMAILGGIIGYILSSNSETILAYSIPFAAGSFIYIASSDLLPEIRKETPRQKSLVLMALFILGVVFMYLLKQYLPE